MQYKVPQFIDIEDKVFGPLTFKQFVYLAGGAGLIYLSVKILPGLVALVLVPVFGGFALALAFYKYNEKPFIHLVESFTKFYMRSRLYLWHKKEPVEQKNDGFFNPTKKEPSNNSKLKTMSWSLGVIEQKK